MCARATPMATDIHCMQAISTVTGPPAPAGVWRLTCLPTTLTGSVAPVSYTHLDVYKRQGVERPRNTWTDKHLTTLKMGEMGILSNHLSAEDKETKIHHNSEIQYNSGWSFRNDSIR